MKQYILLSISYLLANTIFAQTPVVTNFSPASGTIGSPVTITGNNFSANPNDNIVYFGSVRATVNTATASALTVSVPLGATYKPISVTVNGRTAYTKLPFVVTFSGGGNIYDSAFSQQMEPLWANDQSNGTVMADFDGDGKLDIALPAFNSGTIAVMRNTSTTGNISLAPIVNFSCGNKPSGIAMGDLDGDGKLDILTANFDDSTLSILRNNSTPGTLSFLTRDTIKTGPRATRFCIGDIDGDGRLDIVFADNSPLSSNVYGISVLRNTSTGGVLSFAPRKDFAISNGFIAGDIVIGDLNGDGKVDVATATTNSIGFTYPLGIFINTSPVDSIAFATRVDKASHGLAYKLALGDLNGDGLNDLVTANYTTKDFSIFRNTSSGGTLSFSQNPDLSSSGAPTTCVLTDLDGDGKVDLGDGHSNATKFISLYKNTGTGTSITLSIRATLDTADIFQADLRGMNAGDLDGDGLPDLLCVSTNKLVILKNKCTSPFITSFTPTSGVPGTSVTIQGINLINITGVSFGGSPAASFNVASATSMTAVVGAGATGSVAVRNAIGASTLRGFTFSPPIITSFSPASGAVGTTVTISGSSFNVNPADNIVFFGAVRASVINASATALTVTVPVGATYLPISVTCNNLIAFSTKPFNVTFAGASAALSPNSFAPKIDIATQGNPNNIFIADLDGDGKPDVATVSSLSNSISLLRNNSTPKHIAFGSRLDIIGQDNVFLPGNVYITDLDGDGKPDIVATQSGGATVWFYLNTSSPGNFSFVESKLKFPISTYQPSAAAVADFNKDGRPDIVLSTTGNTYVFVALKNTSVPGKLSFENVNEFSTTGLNDMVAVGDYNGDGAADIAFSNRQTSSITVFRNANPVPGGNIHFNSRNDYTSGTNPYSVVACDLDGDDKTDLATANLSSNNISTFRNIATTTTIAFATKVDFASGNGPFTIDAGDVDGDGKPDLIVPNYSADSCTLLQNISTSGNIAFATKVAYKTGANPRSIRLGDIDGDGKPDLVIGNYGANNISILRNKIGEPDTSAICPNSGTTLLANLSGTTYQWQVNDGSGFVNISDNANYTGTNSNSLQLLNVPAAWYGNLYRCVVDGTTNSNAFLLKFVNVWTGAINNNWENAGNWSCGTVPDNYTDVVINSGNVVVHSTVIVRSLQLQPGVGFTVGTGANVTVLY